MKRAQRRADHERLMAEALRRFKAIVPPDRASHSLPDWRKRRVYGRAMCSCDWCAPGKFGIDDLPTQRFRAVPINPDAYWME